MSKSLLLRVLITLFLTSAPSFAQSLADVLSSVQERKRAVEQSKQLVVYYENLNGQNLPIPDQELIDWEGLGTNHFPSDTDLASTGIDARISLLNQAINEFRTIQRSYFNIRAEDLTNDAKLGALRPYMREDFADLGRADAGSYHSKLGALASQVIQLRALPWPTAAKTIRPSYQVLKTDDGQGNIEYGVASNAQVEGWKPATIGPMINMDGEPEGWVATKANGLLIEWIDTENVYGEDESGEKYMHLWMSGTMLSKAKILAKTPGVDANTQLGGNVALVARSAWTPALETDYTAPDSWKNTNAAYTVIAAATNSNQDIAIPLPDIRFNLTWYENAGGGFEGRLSGFEDTWNGWKSFYMQAYQMSLQIQMHRHVSGVAAPEFTKGLNSASNLANLQKATRATASTPGDALPMLQPEPGVLLGIPIGTGMDGGQPAWIGWAPGDTLFHADAPCEFAGQLDEDENPFADQFANTLLHPFHVSGPRQIRFDHGSNLRFIGSAQDFHVVYEPSRSQRGAQLPASSPTQSESLAGGWEGDYEREDGSQYFGTELDFFWKNQFFTAWEAPRLRQVVSRDFIIDITHTGHYSQTIKIYRRPADAGAVNRTPGHLITPEPANLIRTLTCENPGAGANALPAVAEKIVVTEGANKYEVWKDGIEPNYAKNTQPLRFKLTEGTTVRMSKVIEFPTGIDAKVTTTIDGSPAIVDEMTGSWPIVDLAHLYPQITGRNIGWNWWDHRAALSWKKTVGSKITQITNTIDEESPGSQNGAWPTTTEITTTNESNIDLTWNASGRLVSAVQGLWRADYSIESDALKAASKFNNTLYATNWTEWSNHDRVIKSYSAPDGSVTSKDAAAANWTEIELGNASGTGLPGLPHKFTNKDSSGAKWTWTVSNDFSGLLVYESGQLTSGNLTNGQKQTTTWNKRSYTITSLSESVIGGNSTVAGSSTVPEEETTAWGAPKKWVDHHGLSTLISYDGQFNRATSVISPLGLTTNYSNYDIFYRPGQIESNDITANHTYTGLGVSTTYGGVGVSAGSQSSFSQNAEGTTSTTNVTWGGVTQSSATARGASNTTITGSHSLLGSSGATLRKDDGSLSAATGSTLAFGGIAGDALSIVDGLFVTKSAVAEVAGTFATTHTDAWGRTHKIVTPSKSSGTTQTTYGYNIPAAALKRVITTDPSGRKMITESDSVGMISRSGIDVNGNGELGASDRFTESTTVIDEGNIVTTLSVTEDSGMREVLETTFTPATGVTVTKINGNEETITQILSFPTQPPLLYPTKTITINSSKGWSRVEKCNNLGLPIDNDLTGTGIPATSLNPVWRADGTLANISLNIGGETHTASFNENNTLATLTAPGRGNILGEHSISNGVERLAVNGKIVERKLDGTEKSTSGANVIAKSEVLSKSGDGYKDTVTPAVGAATETAFNAALATTGKTYADSTGETLAYIGELLTSITLARGGALTLAYSNDGAKDLTAATWPAMASGSFTIPAIGHGYEYNRSGQIKTLIDPSGTQSLSYHNGRLNGSLYTAGVLKGYQIIPGRDEFGRQTETLLKRDGNTIHTTAKALTETSDQVTNLASGNITATPQRNVAGNITGYIWSDGTNTVTQTWTRGAGGRIEKAESDVAGAPSFDYLLDPNEPAESFDTVGRRLKCETAGGTWVYTYGAGGQLSSAIHPTLGSFTYSFDGIGRRTDKGAANTTDILNRTTAWIHNQNKTLSIKAHPDARVWYNGVEIENFNGTHNAAITSPGAEGGWVPWETLAIIEDAGEGAGDPAANPLADPDAKSVKSGAVWVPPAAETFTFDAAGNRQSSAQFDYGWDAKNQLARVRTKNHSTAAQAYDISFTYDSEGRRIKKHVIEFQNGSIVSENIITFIWDGWDLLYERHQLPSGLTNLERKYLWGPDIADGAAGGAGGLLLIKETKGNATTNIIPLYDGTGHVCALTDINKNLLATYQYGPFGEKISATGTHAQSNPWRYATKYLDVETGLYYYGKRYMDPITGQWLSREPLGEGESINLYSYAGNDPINHVDVLGLRKKEIISGDAGNRFRRNANGEWEVRIVTVETGFWGNKSDYVSEEWQSVSTGQNRLRLLGYAGYDEGGGITTAGSDYIQAASVATGWDENSMKEGTIGAMIAIPSLVAAPMVIAYGITVAPAVYTAGYVKATGASIAIQSSPWGIPIAGGVVTTGAMLLDGEDPATAISSGGLQALTGRATSAPINWSAMRPSNWMPQQFFPSYGGRPGFAPGMVINPFAQTPSRPPAAYSVAMEVQLAPNQMGLSDGKHFNIANMALNQVRATNTIFAENVPAPARWGRAPNGWVWHHARTDQTGGRAGVMQLVPSDQHSSGSEWWRIFHPLPGGWGGYHEWAVPAGAPPRKR